MAQAIVIGCGVIGLSVGIRLREAGVDAVIWAKDAPQHTTSAVAAAVWYPYKAFPQELVARWGAVSYNIFCALAEQPGTGVALCRGIELFTQVAPDPWWRDAVPDLRRPEPGALPAPYVDGYLFATPVIEMPIYLQYLADRFVVLGGTIKQRTVSSLDEALHECGLVLNCSGLGARSLARDDGVYAIRGQIVRTSAIRERDFVIDEHGAQGPTYIVPRSSDCVLGGTAQPGDEQLVPDAPTAEAIMARCTALVPALRDALVLEHRVGLRPGRASVRLEAEQLAYGRVIHCYGHGGAGVTLSWGCAEDVVALV